VNATNGVEAVVEPEDILVEVRFEMLLGHAMMVASGHASKLLNTRWTIGRR
jgi:hypothetical protein